MQASFLGFFVFYVLVAFIALLGIFWQDTRFFWLAGINLGSLLLFWLFSFLLKKGTVSHELPAQEEAKTQEEKVRYPQQFVKYPYSHKSGKKTKSFSGYLLFFSLILFLVSVADLTLFHFFGNFMWVFPIVYLFSLFLSGRDLIDNKIKVFGYSLDFYFSLFVSSLVVAILVYGTLMYSFIPFLWLSALSVSFLFFLVGYLVLKNQGLRFFLHSLYVKLYIIAAVIVLAWAFIAGGFKPALSSVSSYTSKTAVSASSFVRSLFEKKETNSDPLLFTGEGQLINSGVIIQTGVDEEDIFEATGQVISGSIDVNSGVNPVFLGETDTGSVILETGSVTENEDKDTTVSIKEELSISDSSYVSMLDAFRFLMKAGDIPLSSKTDTKFTYVSKTNPSYAYWKTAYDKSIIGIGTNPTTKISCETYQVFKGMVLGWDVKYTSATVKKAYWAEAKKRDLLNGCVFGKMLKGENL